ncbi:MAG TPA: DUF885 family protein, partial [Planctomycetota bacterium]|nr:DUF885 family protein [Planctomycetota bacterium]
LETATQRLADEFPNRGNAIEAPLYASAQTWLRWERAAIGWKDHSDLLSDAEGAHRLPTRYLWEVARPQSVAEWDHYVALLDSLPGYLGQLEDRLRTRAALRTLPPRQVLMRARTRCLAWLAGRPFTSLSSIQSPWQTHALERLEASTQLSQAERNRIADAINRALAQSVGPAYQSLAATLDNLNSQAPEEIGVAARTDGPTWYAYRLERIAGEPVDPADAHSLGLREVSRLRERLREWQQAAGVTETTNAWLQTLREGEDYPRADREAWSLAAERWIATSQERLDLAMPGLLLTPLPIQILAADPDGSSPPLEYQPRDPALEVHPGDWVSIPALCMEAWLAQSSVPGAHLRSAHTLPAKPLPILMRTMELPSLEAGWDLYATRLALEWKLYSGPEAELGQILCELWWAAQLVVDTGIHHRSWTQEESEQYLANNSVFRRSLCQNAVRDIMERPGARAAATLGLQQ